MTLFALLKFIGREVNASPIKVFQRLDCTSANLYFSYIESWIQISLYGIIYAYSNTNWCLCPIPNTSRRIIYWHNGLWNPEVQCRIREGSPIIPILIQINLISNICIYFLRSILILSSRLHLGLPKVLFPVGLLVFILKALLPSSILAIWSAHLKLLDLITLNVLGERYKLWRSAL